MQESESYRKGRKWKPNISKEYGLMLSVCVCHLAEAVEVQYLPLHVGEPDLWTLQLPEFSDLVKEVQPHPGESLDTRKHTLMRLSLLPWLLIGLLLLTGDTYLQFIESLDSRRKAEIMNITGKRRLPILPEKYKQMLTHPLNQCIVKVEQIAPPIPSTPLISQWSSLNRLWCKSEIIRHHRHTSTK